jgi:hypothetical protein
MGNKRLEGDFSPVEIRGYTLKSMQTYSDYTVIAMNESYKVIAVGKEAYQYADDSERAGMDYNILELMKSVNSMIYSSFFCFDYCFRTTIHLQLRK